MKKRNNTINSNNPDSKVHGANMGPPGSYLLQIGSMLAPWTLLSGLMVIV